jgi:hypothetical protein
MRFPWATVALALTYLLSPMPLQPFEHAHITANVSDRVIGGVVVAKQRATYQSMSIEQNRSSGEMSIVMVVLVSLFAVSVTGEYGEAIPEGQGFHSYPVRLYANNLTAVTLDGTIKHIRQQETQEQWAELLANDPDPLMLQGDFFEYVRDNQPLKIGDLIRQHIANADQMGRFS